MRTNPDLEAAILADPDDDEAYLVYGDWLQHRGEPIGRLVSIQHALARTPDDPTLLAAEEALLTSHAASFFGPPHPAPRPQPWQASPMELQLRRLRGLPMTHPVPPQGPRRDRGGWSFGLAHGRWHNGFVREVRFSCSTATRDASFEDVCAAVTGVLACPSARFVRSIALGDLDLDAPARAPIPARTVASAPCADVVRTLHIHAPHTSYCDGSPLWERCRRLEEVELNALHIEVGTLHAPALRRLALQSWGLSTSAVRALDTAFVPNLEDLELWFGTAEKAETPVRMEDLTAILRGDQLPALRRLGLMNCEFGDDICRALPSAAILPRLTRLDLTMGVVTDAGAQVLLDHARDFAHLDLAVAGFFSPDIAAALIATGARVDDHGPEAPPYYVEVFE